MEFHIVGLILVYNRFVGEIIVLKKLQLIIITVLSICLMGCSLELDDIRRAPEQAEVPLATPSPTPEVMEVTDKIFVDEVGYCTSDKKLFLVRAGIENLDGYSYTIENVINKTIVYSGTLSSLSKEETDFNTLYMGDCTELTRSGVYRIAIDDIGYSKDFTIGETIYRDLYAQVYSELKDFSYTDDMELIRTLSGIMLTNEIYPSSYLDDGFISGKVEALMNKYISNGTLSQDMDVNLSASLSGLLAQFATDYMDKTPELAETALYASAKMYDSVIVSEEKPYDDCLYFAACELHRAQGYYEAVKTIEDITVALDNGTETKSEYDYFLIAKVAYLSSTNRPDYDRCEKMLDGLRENVKNISDSCTKETFYVQPDADTIGEEGMLDNMMQLSLVGYILRGREYGSEQRNYLHYLTGINAENKNYLKTRLEKAEDSTASNAILLSKLLFSLGSSY